MRHYEELSGAQGRQVFYRAQRYKAREVFRQALPDCALDGVLYTLHDLSLTGLSATAAPGANDVVPLGAEVPVQLALKGMAFFEARGEVIRVEPAPLGTRVGVRLLDRSINLGHLVAKYEETLTRGDLPEFDQESAVPAEYRQLCADVMHLLRSYRATLDRFEATRPEPQAAADMLALCEERILPRWRTLWHRANALVAPLMGDAETRRAVKRFTELVLTSEFLPGAIWRRSYEKPLGYPGDFQIMQMVYDWRQEGARLFDKLMHRIGLDVAECIATRMVMMRQQIASTVLERAPGETARITSLGCGPAREVIDYLRLRDVPRGVQFNLIDQDQDALASAYENTLSEVMRLRGKASVNCLQVSFMQLLKPGSVLATLPPQDLIYTVGLVDYLTERRAKALVKTLWSQLAPGGTLIVGNMFETPTGNLWPMEFVCDWNIVYRSEAEMADLASGLEGATATTSLDPTGRVVLVTIRKS